MRFSIHIFPAFLFAVLMMGIGCAQAFSFDFGDDDNYWGNPYWGAPGWGGNYRPLVAPNGAYFYPRLPYFERSRMVDNRHGQMRGDQSAMNALGAMLYGRSGFDRAEAIKLTRFIEATSGRALTDNFHPGAIATYDSRATLALWGNRETFEANARALQQAAKVLAEEFEKQPTEEQGAVFLVKRVQRFGPPGKEKVAVSPGVWEKFNTLSSTCDSCHRGFRGINRY